MYRTLLSWKTDSRQEEYAIFCAIGLNQSWDLSPCVTLLTSLLVYSSFKSGKMAKFACGNVQTDNNHFKSKNALHTYFLN